MTSNQNEYIPESEESPRVSQETRNPKEEVSNAEKKEATKRTGTQDYGNNVDPDNTENGTAGKEHHPGKVVGVDEGKDFNDLGYPDGTGKDEPGRRKQMQEEATGQTDTHTNMYTQEDHVQDSDAPDPEIKNDNTTGTRGLKEEGADERSKRSLDEHAKTGSDSADGSSANKPGQANSNA